MLEITRYVLKMRARVKHKLPPGAIIGGEAVTGRRSAIYADQILPHALQELAQNEHDTVAWPLITDYLAAAEDIEKRNE